MKSRALLLLWTALAFAAVAPSSQVRAQTSAQTQQDLKKSCNAEAKSQKLKGDARKSFLSDCMSGNAAGSTQSPSQGTAQAPAKSQSQAPSSGTSQPTKPSGQTAAAPAAAGQFTSEADARRHCASDRVVWANTASHIYHYGGTKDYGNTKQGAYMCQQDADREGFRAAKNETAPAK